MAPERCPRDSAKRGSGSGRNTRPRQSARGAPTAGHGSGSSFGRHCSALRGRAQPLWDRALRAVCLVRLLAKGINHSRRRLWRIPSRKAAVAPAEICSAVP